MNIREVPWGSDLYEASVRFRDRVLREPLGLEISAIDTQGEDSQFHIAAVDEDGKIAGTVVLKPLSRSLVKLRQMAVDQTRQKAGIGRKLVEFAEFVARREGYQRIELHARQTARGFYEKLAYESTGVEFLEATLPHIKMFKQIPAPRKSAPT
jgi:predicted GNAT family N-acyltransferase